MHEITSRVPSLEYLYAASLGQVPGARVVQVQGVNPDIDVGTVPEGVNPFGGLFQWQTTAVAMEAVSTSADDAAAGLGVRTIIVQGLGNSHEEISEVVTLNGLTPVALVNQYRRINNAFALTVGGGVSGSNVGDIIIRTTVGATPQAFMPAGYGRDQCCRYTVPAGYNMYVIDGFVSLMDFASSSTIFCAFQLYARDFGGPFLSRVHVTVSGATPTYHIRPPTIRGLAPGADIALRATNVSASNLLVSATLNLLLLPL